MTAVEIVRLRRRLGLSQTQLAERLGVSTRAVENWEQGLRRPREAACTRLEEIARRPRR